MTYIVNNSFKAKGNKNRQKRGLQWRFWLFLGITVTLTFNLTAFQSFMPVDSKRWI